MTSSPFLDKELRSLSDLLAEWQNEIGQLENKRRQISARLKLLHARTAIITKCIEEEPQEPLI